MLIQTLSIVAITSLLEALAWGTVGYFIFRVFNLTSYKWYIECLIISILLFCFNFQSSKLLIALDISIGNEEVLEFIGSDLNSLLEMDIYNVVFIVVEVFLGYRFGEILFERIRNRMAAVS